jgi:hypothetical protein
MYFEDFILCAGLAIAGAAWAAAVIAFFLGVG